MREKTEVNEEVIENDVSLNDLLKMQFNAKGELKSADYGKLNMFRKLNHHERRVKAAIERRTNKRKKS